MLDRFSGLAGAAVALAVAPAAVAEILPPEARQHELEHLVLHDCGSCHGLTLKGGLGPPLLPGDLAGTPDDVLVDTILHGRPGTPMPPWSFALSQGDAEWLVERLREGNFIER